MKLVAISDTHGRLDFKVPPCDLLIHAGDICPDFAPGSSWGSEMQLQWFKSKFSNWIDIQPVEAWFSTWGNHDYISRASDLEQMKYYVRIDELIEWPYENGILKIWFSPWSNQFGSWAWMLDPELLERKYAQIPADTNIIVSHQPPYGLGDEIPENYAIYNDGNTHVGSQQLLNAIERVRPSYVICGHIHNGHGVYDYPHDDGFKTRIVNCAIVNEQYKRVYEPVEIEL